MTVLERGRIAFGDLAGNNRIDSYRNLVAHPRVAMLFVIPGLEDTMRVNGTATVTVDEGVRRACPIDGRLPNLAVVVDVDTCFMHCGKALRRSRVWESDTWPAEGERPSGADLLKAHAGGDMSIAEIADALEAGYRATLWEPGGAGSAS